METNVQGEKKKLKLQKIQKPTNTIYIWLHYYAYVEMRDKESLVSLYI